METEGSYPVHKSPSLVSSPYPERDKSSPRLPILFLMKWSFHLRLGFLSSFFPLGLTTNPYMHFSPIRAKCHAHPYSPWFDDLYNTGRRIKITNLFIIMVSPASCTFSVSKPNILSALCSGTPLAYCLPLTKHHHKTSHKTRKIHPIRIVST